MNHFVGYFITSCLILIGMALGFHLYSKATIEIGMAALTIVFAIYSVGEAIGILYPEEENDDA